MSRAGGDELAPASLEAFLDSVMLLSDVDEWDAEAGGVTLMTLHSAKGLEFPTVLGTGLEEGVFPHTLDEGQLTYERRGLERIVDLGEWWLLETGLPLPLGINVARRDLGAEVLPELSDVLRDSIRAGLANRDEALAYALQYGRGLTTELADQFVGMYVNELTEDYGEEGRQAVAELLRRGEEAGAFERPIRVEFVE